MSIFSFDIRCVAGHTPIFEGSAVFGNFNAAALEKQTGLPISEDDAAWFREDCPVSDQPASEMPRLATGGLRMIDRITGFGLPAVQLASGAFARRKTSMSGNGSSEPTS